MRTTDSGDVVVLVFVKQQSTLGSQAPTSATSRVEVTMRADGDDWLIAGLVPV